MLLPLLAGLAVLLGLATVGSIAVALFLLWHLRDPDHKGE